MVSSASLLAIAAAALLAQCALARVDFCRAQIGKKDQGEIWRNLRTGFYCDGQTSKQCVLPNSTCCADPWCKVVYEAPSQNIKDRVECLSFQKTDRFCDWGCSGGRCSSPIYCRGDDNRITFDKYCSADGPGGENCNLRDCAAYVDFEFDQEESYKAVTKYREIQALYTGSLNVASCNDSITELLCLATFIPCWTESNEFASYDRAECALACKNAYDNCQPFQDFLNQDGLWIDAMSDRAEPPKCPTPEEYADESNSAYVDDVLKKCEEKKLAAPYENLVRVPTAGEGIIVPEHPTEHAFHPCRRICGLPMIDPPYPDI